MNWKNLLPSSILIILLLFLNQAVVVSASYANVTVSEAKEMIESNPNLVILDVRTQEEYDSGHLEDAVLIPVSELEVDELDEEKETLVYCRSGSRSATASQILVDNGFSSVYNMLGGITAWRDAGYWIEIIHRGDLTSDGTVDIRDITIVAMAFGSNIGDENWNIITDLNDGEVIDIRDITTVAMEFGKTV